MKSLLSVLLSVVFACFPLMTMAQQTDPLPTDLKDWTVIDTLSCDNNKAKTTIYRRDTMLGATEEISRIEIIDNKIIFIHFGTQMSARYFITDGAETVETKHELWDEKLKTAAPQTYAWMHTDSKDMCSYQDPVFPQDYATTWKKERVTVCDNGQSKGTTYSKYSVSLRVFELKAGVIIADMRLEHRRVHFKKNNQGAMEPITKEVRLQTLKEYAPNFYRITQREENDCKDVISS